MRGAARRVLYPEKGGQGARLWRWPGFLLGATKMANAWRPRSGDALAPLDQRAEELRHAFAEHFPGAPAPVIVRAPGRVNLIGEHTDYHEGFVLPAAVDRDTLVALAPRADSTVEVVSLNLGRRSSFDVGHVVPATGPDRWSNYVRGVALMLRRWGKRVTGANVAVASTVPIGAGLSSSAALEVAVAYGLLKLAGDTADDESDRLTLARWCQRAENEFVGVNCGIMDQTIVALGRAGHALVIDCRSLDTRLVPLPSDGVSLVLADTRVSRGLASSQYNVRRSECDAALGLLRQRLGEVAALRDLSVEQLEACHDLLPEVLRRRCRHVVTENARVLEAVRALDGGGLERFGELMDASHESLRDDYEVSCAELDVLVEAARDVPGVLGSRMTGAGFGGCTVTLVRDEAVERLRRNLRETYRAKTGRFPRTYVTAASAGLSLVAPP